MIPQAPPPGNPPGSTDSRVAEANPKAVVSPASGERLAPEGQSKQAGGDGRPAGKESKRDSSPGDASTPLPLRFGLSGSRPAPPSYSQMLNDIRQGQVREIALSPRQRVATITYNKT